MMEFIITSSVLIIVIIALRFLFRGKISRRLQYALWGLVLLRLLMPVSIFGSQFSIMNVIDRESVTQAASQIQVYSDMIRNTEMSPEEAETVGSGNLHEIQGGITESGDKQLRSYIFTDSLDVVLGRILGSVWLIGSITAGLWFLGANIVFYRKLMKTRRLLAGSGIKLPVYFADGLYSPCLFGLLHPAIYVTSKAIDNEASTHYVLAHEQGHYRHGDHIWSILRGLCLAVWWWHPLVWAAALLSRTDSEMACDEAVIRQLGEDNRLEYGRTIIDMIAVKKERAGLLCTATAMSAGNRSIKKRLNTIIKRPKTVIPAAAAVLLIAAVCVGCTFTGAQVTASPSADDEGVSAFAQQLYDVRNPFVGDASADGALLLALGVAEKIGQYSLELDTKKEPYILRVVFSEEIADAAALNAAMNDNAMLLLALINNVSEIQWRYHYFDIEANGSGDYTGALTADDATASLNGKDIKSYGKSASDVQALLDWLASGESSPGAGVDTAGNIDRTNLEACVSDAILDANASPYHPGDFAAEAHASLGVTENGNTTTVYAMAMYMAFGYAGDGFTETGGSHIPVAITFEKNNAGEYTLKEYWTPQDGSYYSPSIRDKFPPEFYNDALDTQKYVMNHARSCYAQAIEYGKVPIDAHLNKLIETICTSPAASSNPGDYIKAHPIEYREMLYYGNYTLEYCFALFEKGGQTGLAGHIMALACKEIIGEAAVVDVPTATGQDWYNAYKNTVQQNGFIINNALDKEAVMEAYRQNQLDTAQRMAQLYIDTIQNGQDLENGEDAIAMFDLLFNRQTLTMANLHPADNMPDAYQCDIVGSGPVGARTMPLFVIFQDDNPRFFCPLSRYGKQSRSAVEAYIKYLSEGDAAKLSQFLSVDEGKDDFINEANRLIEHYRQYDLSKTLIIRFDYDYETERFIYRVEDGNKEVFEIYMNYGDGLTMPDISSVLP